MTETSPTARVRENVTGVASVIVTGVWLAALFSGQGWWLPAMLFGYVVVVPLVGLLAGDREAMRDWWDGGSTGDTDRRRDRDTRGADEALATLRERYARGELTDEQFERKLDRLLETETVEDLEDRTAERVGEHSS